MTKGATQGLARRIEIAANVAILGVAVVIAGFLLRNWAGGSLHRPPGPLGTKVALAGVDSAGRRSIVLVLSVHCHFCTESADFYRRLSAECRKEGVRVSAFLPQSEVESRAYLSGLGISVDDVRQVPLATLRLDATPTLLLVDPSGVVKKTWVGKLQDNREQQVLAAVDPANGS